jgi:hypothetical protein
LVLTIIWFVKYSQRPLFKNHYTLETGSSAILM